MAAGKIFCSFGFPCPGTTGVNLKTHKIESKIKKYPAMLCIRDGDK